MTLRRVATALTCVLLLGAANAVAQDSTSMSSELEQTASMSDTEKISYAASSNAEISDAFAQVDKLLSDAEDDGDTGTIQCVTLRHAAIKALQQVSSKAEVDMKAAIADANVDKANHEVRKIAVALSRTRSLLAEAERCLGGELKADGSTSVDVFVEEELSIFDDDPLDIDETDLGIDPPDFSPFL